MGWRSEKGIMPSIQIEPTSNSQHGPWESLRENSRSLTSHFVLGEQRWDVSLLPPDPCAPRPPFRTGRLQETERH